MASAATPFVVSGMLGTWAWWAKRSSDRRKARLRRERPELFPDSLPENVRLMPRRCPVCTRPMRERQIVVLEAGVRVHAGNCHAALRSSNRSSA